MGINTIPIYVYASAVMPLSVPVPHVSECVRVCLLLLLQSMQKIYANSTTTKSESRKITKVVIDVINMCKHTHVSAIQNVIAIQSEFTRGLNYYYFILVRLCALRSCGCFLIYLLGSYLYTIYNGCHFGVVPCCEIHICKHFENSQQFRIRFCGWKESKCN